MPPASPDPGGARGEVWYEITARCRGTSRSTYPDIGKCPVNSAQLVLVALAPLQEVESPEPVADGPLDEPVEQDHARAPAVAGGIEAAVVEVDGVAHHEGEARTDGLAAALEDVEGEPAAVEEIGGQGPEERFAGRRHELALVAR